MVSDPKTLLFSDKYNSGVARYSSETLNLPRDTPEFIKDFFNMYGLSRFDQGFLWTIDPIKSKRLYDPFFRKIQNVNPSFALDISFPFMRTAFGDILYFQGGSVGSLSVVTGVDSMLDFDSYINDILINQEDLDNMFFHDIFVQSLDRLGELDEDECYGFLPTLSMGGDISPETVHRVKLKEYLSILSENES